MKMKSLFGIIGLAAATVSCAGPKAEQWEHGWKTPRIIATRYSNEYMGFNIGFKFKDIYRSDRKEVSDFMEAHHGFIYQGGGYPGAEVFVVFSTIKTKEDADKQLPLLLPELDDLMRTMK